MGASNAAVTVRPKNKTGPWSVELRITEGGRVDTARFRFRLSGDAPELVGAELVRTERITPSDLQRFGWSQWSTVALAAVRQQLAGGGRRVLDPGDALHQAVSGAMGIEPARRKPGPKPSRGPDFFEGIAARYLELLSTGERAPNKRLGEELGFNGSTIRGFVRTARAMGFLPPAQHGKVG